MTLEIQSAPRDPQATKVLIKGTVFTWAEKAPFTPSGYSLLGALEVNETETKIKCHECGEWHAQIAGEHLKAHRLPGPEYRNRHGIRVGVPLTAPESRRLMAANMRSKHADPALRKVMVERLHPPGETRRAAVPPPARVRNREPRAETANLRMNCRAQLTIRLTNLAAKLGHTPSRSEIRAGDEHGKIEIRTLQWAFQMTVSEVLQAIGLTPKQGGKQRIASPTELASLQLRAAGTSYPEIARRAAARGDTLADTRAESNSGPACSTASSR